MMTGYLKCNKTLKSLFSINLGVVADFEQSTREQGVLISINLFIHVNILDSHDIAQTPHSGYFPLISTVTTATTRKSGSRETDFF